MNKLDDFHVVGSMVNLVDSCYYEGIVIGYISSVHRLVLWCSITLSGGKKFVTNTEHISFLRTVWEF